MLLHACHVQVWHVAFAVLSYRAPVHQPHQQLITFLCIVSTVYICCRCLSFSLNGCCSCLSPQNCCLQGQMVTPKLSKHSCKLGQYGHSPHWLNSSLRLLSLTWRLSCRSFATCLQMVQLVVLMLPCMRLSTVALLGPKGNSLFKRPT